MKRAETNPSVTLRSFGVDCVARHFGERKRLTGHWNSLTLIHGRADPLAARPVGAHQGNPYPELDCEDCMLSQLGTRRYGA